MGTYTYTLSAPSRARTIHLIDGTKAKLVTLSFFCRSNDAEPEYAYDERDRRERTCLANVLERKREAWRETKLPKVYAVLVHKDRSGEPEEGREVYLWESAPVRDGHYDYDPIWFDCLKMPAKQVGTLRRTGRRWELDPGKPALLVLAEAACEKELE
jgi:hypothetical protein